MIIRYQSCGNKFLDAIYPLYLLFSVMIIFAFLNDFIDSTNLDSKILLLCIYIIGIFLGGILSGVVWYKIITPIINTVCNIFRR